MHYAVAKLDEQKETTAYRVYVTDCLYYSGMADVKERFWDWIHKKPQSKDTRIGDEIAFDIIKRMGLKAKGGEK